MEFIDAILLGVVQGLSEFLPISSSGHLVVFQNLLTPGPHSIPFDLALHMGTVFSILTLYASTIKQVIADTLESSRKRTKTPGLQLALYVFIANIPTALIGFGFKDQLKSLFSNLFAVGICFFITGILLWFTKLKSANADMNVNQIQDINGVSSLTWKKSLIIGIVQGLAIAPGISRSGSTIAAAILIGVERKTAALFSFVMSIPAILGAGIIELKDFSPTEEVVISHLVIGFLAAYISGLFGLWVVLKFVKKGRLEVFSYYLWALSVYIIFKQIAA
ncbi:MAG: undecaprenyl-diphosphate phosphatase [Bdellovibrionales bacterium]